MDRRGFFKFLGALGAAPLIGRVARLLPPVERAYQARILYVGKGGQFSTLQEALRSAASGAGDTIYVLPGHSETITDPIVLTGQNVMTTREIVVPYDGKRVAGE